MRNSSEHQDTNTESGFSADSPSQEDLSITENGLFDIVREVLVDVLDVTEEQVVLDAIISDDLGVESLDHVDINFRLAKRLNILIPFDSEITRIHADDEEEKVTVRTVVQYLRNHKGINIV